MTRRLAAFGAVPRRTRFWTSRRLVAGLAVGAVAVSTLAGSFTALPAHAAPVVAAAKVDASRLSQAVNVERASGIMPMRFATGGAGQYQGAIDWFEWGGQDEQIPAEGLTRSNTREVPGGTLVTTCTVGSPVGGELVVQRPGSYSGDGLDDLYNEGGTGVANELAIGLANRVSGQTVGFGFDCAVTLDGEDVPLAGLVMADAEASNSATGEYVQATIPAGAEWRMIDRYRDESCTTDSNITRTGQTLRLAGSAAPICPTYPTGVAFMQGSSSADVQLYGSGRSAVALGVVLFSDFGDAPEGYGDAGALYSPGFTGPVIPQGNSTLFGSSLSVSGQPALRLGSAVTPESGSRSSAGASLDEADDGVRFNTDVSIPGRLETVWVEASAPGFLNAWIDFNRNGAFDEGERIADDTAVVAGANQITYTVPEGEDFVAGTSYARFRISAGSGEGTEPAGVTTNGEVEDYVRELFDAADEALGLCVAGTEPVPVGLIQNPSFEDRTGDFVNTGASTIGYAEHWSDSHPTGGQYHVYAPDFDSGPAAATQPVRAGADGLAFEGGHSTGGTGEGAVSVLTAPLNPDATYVGFFSMANGGYTRQGDGFMQFLGTNDLQAGSIPHAAVTPQTPANTELLYSTPVVEYAGNGVRPTWELNTFQLDASQAWPYLRVEVRNATPANDATVAGQVWMNFDDFHMFECEPIQDFGDAPASYGTSLEDDGPRHLLPGYDADATTASLMLGTLVDEEADGFASDAARGDDEDAAADEDGVAGPVEIVPGVPSTVSVTATNDTDAIATLAGWVDLDGDGSFEESERVTAPIPAGSGAASYQLTFPAGSTTSDTFARFRVFPGAVAAPAPTGAATAGEVEDYAVSIGELPRPLVCTADEIRATERFWFFGQNGAIDFGASGNEADAFLGSQTTREGSTVVTDTSGALQFWSNGQEVFDRNSEPMPNGTGLLGNRSATQTVAAFPALGQPGKFFVVTTSTDVGTAPNGSLMYSVVDMNLNGGLGDVTDVKNVPLGAPNTASEAVTAVPNADGTGFWVLSHTNNSPNILAYEFDADGPVTGTPVVNVMPSNNFNGYGSLAFSADYTSVVALTAQWTASGAGAGTLPSTVRILKFNAETGQLFQDFEWSLPATSGSGGMGYNAEFSPDGRYVYATKIFGSAQLYRYDLEGAATGAEVKATEENVGVIGTSGGQIRRAPDGRMYVANLNAASLGVVNAPDAADPDFVAGGFQLAGGAISQFGLPQTVTGCPPPVGTLEITKSSSMTENSRAGDTVTYTLTVENVGSGDYTAGDPAVVFDDLTGVVDDALYNGDAAAAASDGSSIPAPVFIAPSHISWAGPLVAGESVEITYSVRLTGAGDGVVRNVAWQPGTPPPPGEVPETPVCDPATEEGTDPVTGEACALVETAMPRLSVTKTSDVADLPADGGEVTYTVTVTNEGPGVYTEGEPARVTDDLSAVLDDAQFGEILSPTSGASFDADAQELTWSGALDAGEAVTISYTVTYDATTGDNVLLNVACVAEDEVLPGAEDCASVRIPAAELVVTKSVDPADGTAVEAGQTLNYTLTFDSRGEAAAAVDKVDDLSGVLDDSTLVDGSLAVTGNGLTAELNGTDLVITGAVPAGETTTVSYSVEVDAYADQVDHVLANVVQNPDGSCGVDGCPETENPIRHFAVTKSATPVEGVQAGDVVEYTVTVTNDGEADYTVVNPARVSDEMSDVLDDASYNGDVAAEASTGATVPAPAFAAPVLTWSGPLPVGESVQITYSVTVTNQGDADLVNIASPVCADGVICDPPTPPVEVFMPRITPEKTSDPASGSDVAAGDVVTYTLTFTNDGQAAGEIGTTDDLSDVLDDAELSSDPETDLDGVAAIYDADAQTIRIEGDLAAGATVTVTYQVTVLPDGERGDNVIANVATPDVPPYVCADGDEACEPFVPPTTEHLIGELDDWKTVDPVSGGSVRPGQVMTYTLHFENTGEAPVAVSREDALTQVLDDATITAVPTSSDAALAVSDVIDGRFAVTGVLAVDQVVTVTYQVTVNADGARGDDRLGNFLVDAGEEPPTECVPTDDERPDCTVNHVSFVVASKSADPASGTAVEQGREVTYTLTFRNVSTNPDAAASPIDYTDHMAGILDDATLTGVPQSSDTSVAASTSAADRTIRVTGEVAPGETVTVTYAVTAKAYTEQGDHVLGNVIAVTGEEPVCAPDSDLCTTHDAIEPDPLAVTGGDVAWGVLITALVLIVVGGGVLLFTRRRRAETENVDN